MATLLVIGGSGFFGKSILDYFQRNGLSRWGIDRVVAVARRVDQLKITVPHLVSQNVELWPADICATRSLPDADIVIHAAASTDASKYLSQPKQERDNILSGTINYCRLAHRIHSSAKILYVSSGAVYGNQPAGIDAMSEHYVPQNPYDISPGKRDYAAAKRNAEDMIMKLGQQGLSVSIARCFAFVGTWLPRDQHFAIGNFIDDGLCGRPIQVKARHPVYRSYMYADDLVEWLMTIACNSNPDCPVYNVGSGQAVLLGDLAEIIAHEFGLPAIVSQIIEGDTDRYVPSVVKATRSLGLSLRYDLLSAIRNTITSLQCKGVNGA